MKSKTHIQEKERKRGRKGERTEGREEGWREEGKRERKEGKENYVLTQRKPWRFKR